MESWTGEKRAFSVNTFYGNNDSYLTSQVLRAFRINFNLTLNDQVTSYHAFEVWVNKFEEMSNTVKKRGGIEKRVCSPGNVARVEEAFFRSPKRSARR